MPFIPPEQLARAREMDLLTYLRCCEPDELVSVGGNAYATKSHDSLKISNGEWYWWSRGVGGSSALDYLTTVRKLSLPDAVQRVLSAGGVPLAEPPRRKARPTKSFSLPPRHADNRRVFSYLRGRGIDPEIINYCIKHGLLYESAQHHNCVFVGFAGDRPAYAMQRGTLQDKRFVGEVAGSDKRYSFAVPMTPGDSPTLCVFESAIDALSYLTLLKQQGQDWRKANTLSLGGISTEKGRGLPPPLSQYLKTAPHISRFVLCLDNDAPGRMAAALLRELLRRYEVIDRPPVRGKDYNELLLYRRDAQRGEAR